MEKNVLVAFGIALISSPLVSLVISWLRERSISAKRAQAWEQAGKRVAFLESWFNAQKLVRVPNQVETARAVTQRELDLTLKTSREMSRGWVKPFVPFHNRSRLQRWSLWFAHGSFASLFFRILFYIVVVFFVFTIIGYVFMNQRTGEFEFSKALLNRSGSS